MHIFIINHASPLLRQMSKHYSSAAFNHSNKKSRVTGCTIGPGAYGH